MQISALGQRSLIQRFGSAANLNIHLHCLVLDGVYRRSEAGVGPVFVEARAPITWWYSTPRCVTCPILRRPSARHTECFARRVGWQSFDGDYTTITVALGDFEPFQPRGARHDRAFRS